MTNEEKAIARAIAEHLGMAIKSIATDVGAATPSIPPYRANGNDLRVTVGGEEYDVRVIVVKREGYIG
jgi:hypothetical protein